MKTILKKRPQKTFAVRSYTNHVFELVRYFYFETGTGTVAQPKVFQVRFFFLGKRAL